MLFVGLKLRSEMKLTHPTFFKRVVNGRTSALMFTCSLRVGRNRRLQFGTIPTARLLPEQDGQQHPETQGEEPQRGRRRSYRPDPAQFSSGNSGIEDQPAGVAPFKQEKGQCCRSTVNQVSHERWKQRGSCISAPVADTSKHQRQEGHWSEIPPNQTKQPAPRYTKSEARSLVSKQQPVTHANQGANRQMNQQTTKAGKAAAQSGNFRQYAGGKHHQSGDHTANNASQRSPLQQAQDAYTLNFAFALERNSLLFVQIPPTNTAAGVHS